MAEDKRRRARVQSKWSQPCMVPPANLSASPDVSPPLCCAHRMKSPDKQFASDSSFVFMEDAKQIVTKKPSDIFIDVQYYPNFIDDEREKKEMFDVLFRTVPWQEKFCVINGERMKMPRLVAWYGPMPYRFAGTTLPPVDPWPAVVQFLHDRISSTLGYEFNSVLLNLYENGKSSVAWHSDNELLMGIHPVIASLSFGETRMFELREKTPLDGNYDNVQHVKIPLTAGSLLIMEGETQSYWQHRIPKEFHDRKARINLTFRTVFLKD